MVKNIQLKIILSFMIIGIISITILGIYNIYELKQLLRRRTKAFRSIIPKYNCNNSYRYCICNRVYGYRFIRYKSSYKANFKTDSECRKNSFRRN